MLTPQKSQSTATLSLLALGVVYGDIGTSPLYAVKETFNPEHGIPLTAVEGLEVGTSAFKPYVVPIATGVLVGLFLIQKHGTGVVGLLFGPVCALWFLSIGMAGAWQIAQQPSILAALDPRHAFGFIT